MKHLLLSVLLFLFSFSSVFSNQTLSEDGPRVPQWIIIGQAGGNGPRSPAVVPIQGVVYHETIYISFLSDLGNVDVVLENDLVGHLVHTVVDSSASVIHVAFGGDDGNYTITFTLVDGTTYVGNFIIIS